MAVKYCGGCNPVFDRVEYFNKLVPLAGEQIEWVTLDDFGFDAVLLIQGCDTACLEERLNLSNYKVVIIKVRNNQVEPQDLVKTIMRGIQ